MTEEPKRSGRYVNRYFCKRCDNRLSFGQKMDSHGVCPYCGANSHSTVVNTNERSVWVEDVPFLPSEIKLDLKDIIIALLFISLSLVWLFK